MKNLLIIMLFFLSFTVQGQFFQFSQRHFTPQRVSPGAVGSTDYFHAMMNFRNQTTAGGFSLLSTALDLAYPVSWGGERRGGVGAYFMDDRAGTQGIYSIQEAGFSTAISIPTAEKSSFNLGLGLGYQRRSLDLGGLSTGSQFVPDRGFDTSLSSGENFGELNTSFVRWNAGVYWRQDDARDNLKSYIGLSAFDINEPNESIVNGESLLSMTLVAEAGLSVHRSRESILYAEAFAFGANENYSLQAGVMFQKEMSRDQNLQIRARYSTEHFVMLGATIQKDQFFVGASYDLAIGQSSVSNQSAFEVGLGWKMFVKPKGKKRKKKGKKDKNKPTSKPQAALKLDTLVQEQPEPEVIVPDTTSVVPEVAPETEVRIGQPVSEKRVVDEYQVRLPFKFNSSELSTAFTQFLDDVVSRLKANPDQEVEIIGHTDNVGAESVNLDISVARARSVAEYLINEGIDPSRIKVEGRGEALPISNNDTPQGRALNRRVEIKVLQKN